MNRDFLPLTHILTVLLTLTYLCHWNSYHKIRGSTTTEQVDRRYKHRLQTSTRERERVEPVSGNRRDLLNQSETTDDRGFGTLGDDRR